MNKIIKELNLLQPGRIYTIAPKHYVSRGYEYYRLERLDGFVWSEDKNILVARVMGSRPYLVSITSSNDGGLVYECTCPAWSPYTQCKHVICTLMTIKNIFNPKLFNTSGKDERLRDALASQFLSHDSTPLSERPENDTLEKTDKGYSIIIEKRYPFVFPVITLRRRGNAPFYYPSSYFLPEELRWVESSGYGYFNNRENVFINYLTSHGNTYPLILISGKEEIPLRWDGDNRFSSTVHLDVRGNRVGLRREFRCGGRACKKPCLLGSSLVVDLEEKRLGLLGEKKGWRLWKLWSDDMDREFISRYSGDYYPEINSVKIPLDQYQKEPFHIPGKMIEDLDELILTVNGRSAEPIRTDYTCFLSVEEDHDCGDSLLLRLGCDQNGVRSSTSRDLFAYLHFFGSGWHMAAPLRAKKRRRAMISAFMLLLSARTQTEAKRIIKDTLANRDFRKRRLKSEARGLLMNAYTRFQVDSYRIQSDGESWFLSKSEKDREKVPYLVLFDLFGPDIFMEMRAHNEVAIPSGLLYANLSTLSEMLEKSNIRLSFNDKPVRVSSLDVSVDLSRSGEIDWFELKPEIRCSREVIDEKEWERIISNNGVLEGKGYVQILDTKSREILKTIASIYGGVGDKRDKKREIVRIPRLMILDWIGLRKKGVKVRLTDEDDEVIKRLLEFKRIEKRPIPASLKPVLRDYQMDAYYWLSFLYEHHFGACLADDMGLGKTLQAISLLAGIKEGMVKSHRGENLLHLIVLPPSLLFNWESEIKRFYPDLMVHLYAGADRTLDHKDCDIVLTTYGIIRRDIESLKERRFNVIIFDEAQAIKNIYAETTSAVRQLKANFKLTMTGTPIENHLGEYYSILDLSLPGLLGSYEDFKPLISSSRKAGSLESSIPSLDIILNRTRPFLLRRTKEEILKELPPKVETDIYLEPTERQKSIYKKTVEMVRNTINDAYNTKTKAQAQIIALTAILRLRQICVSPKLLDPSIQEASPKVTFLIDRLKELIDEGHSALVFSQFTSFLDIVEVDIKESGIPYVRLDGSTPAGRRRGLVERFQNGKGPSIFLLSLKAGGQGLNLTKASYVFHLDPWWNPAVENQASDRAHRIGQNSKVSIFRLLMRHTIEEKMMSLKKRKLALFRVVVDGGAGKKKGIALSKADFDYLLSS